MRTHIDYGIYFNNDFCQIARMEEGMPVIKLSDLVKESMPLCVSFNRKGEILVGETAFNIFKADKVKGKVNSNSFLEFVRTLGTNHTYESSNTGKSYSAEELLAECFKKLKSFIQDENAKAVAIIIPARYQYQQIEAVKKAGQLAGFEQIELIQEPIAAATSFGMASKVKSGYFLVFDFQGEFHISLCKAEEGIISIVDTGSDNWLGDKIIPEAIVDEIIIPYLKNKYAIDFVLQDSDKKEILKNSLRFYAEEAKAQLNNKKSYCILSNIGDLPFEDENGDEPELDIEISPQDMARLSRPIYQKAIDITIDLLKRNNKKGKDIENIILVGEETYSPILRNLLKEQITDKIDTSIDPITVVVKGVALYAHRIPLDERLKEINKEKNKIQLDIKYEATTVELDELVCIKVVNDKTLVELPEKIYAEIVRKDGIWSSGKKRIGDKTTIIDALLAEQPNNIFQIRTYDEFGNNLECEPNEITFIRGFQSHQITLPYNIGIAKHFESEGKELFQTIKGLEKNRHLPATGVINGFKTKFALRPGMVKDIIRIPIYQGDYNAEGTNPLLNNLIFEIVISGESLPAMLPEGSDVDITIKVDRSEQMLFSAYFPLLNHTEELQVDIKATKPPTEEELTKEILKAKRIAQKVNAVDVSEKLDALEEQLKNEKGSADGKMKTLDGLRKELLKLENAEKIAEWPKIENSLKNTFCEFEKHSNSELQIAEFRKTIEVILKEKNLKEARVILEEITEFINNREIDFNYIDDLKGELVLFYSDNPGLGKERFRFLLGELIRIEKNGISVDEKLKVVDSVKKEILK